MMELLPHLIYIHTGICTYVCRYYTARGPMFLVYEVYMRSCRVSSLNSSRDDQGTIRRQIGLSV